MSIDPVLWDLGGGGLRRSADPKHKEFSAGIGLSTLTAELCPDSEADGQAGQMHQGCYSVAGTHHVGSSVCSCL